jgi:cytoskeletal protein CcmA (bactofilin family)
MQRTIGVSAVLSLLVLPFLVSAAEVRYGEQASLAGNERIASDFYIAGGNVSSAGPVTADLAAVGGNVMVTSAVTQDVLVAGGSVAVLGTVGDDLRIAGGNITIGGQIRGDLIAGGGQTQVSGSGISGDVLWGGGTLRIEAPVAGNLKLAGGEVYINSTVGGNVEFMGEKITLGRNAVIEGDFSYTSANEVVIEEGAAVRGETNFTRRENPARGIEHGFAAVTSLAFLAGFLMRLISALLLALIFHRYARTLVENVTERPLLELGRGFATFAITPVASIVLLVTVLGVPLGLLGLILFAAMIIFASLLAPVILGSVLHKLVMKPAAYQVTWLTILIGVVVYTILGWIPFIGWIGKCVLVLMTLGAIVKIKWDAGKSWR